MKISNVYIGGWFQRTMLQLSEVYDFLRNGESQLKLNKRNLPSFVKILILAMLNMVYLVKSLYLLLRAIVCK